MIKKILTAFMAVSVFLTACSGDAGAASRTSGTTQTVNDILEQGLAGQEAQAVTLYTPEDYIGKIIKMEGACSFYHDDITGNEYYSCIIKDATACCAQGIEFVPVNPEAVPGEGGDVTVVGVFDTYKEGDYMYCTLRNANIL